ncbi:MAG: glycoside hydrolase family 27 protein [Opitutales bacterium]
MSNPPSPTVRRLVRRLLPALAGLTLAASASELKFEGLAPTPPMGWNSWNTFATNISEDLIKGVADAMIANGMRDAGYIYINLDDGWMAMERDADGNLMAHPERFPSGMKALADYLHERGFKFGVYNCAGTKTCAGYPGSMGHEFQDALKYAEWGVDYLKYDWCHTGSRDAYEAYTTMGRALVKAGRPVVFSICEWGHNEPWIWGPEVGHLWRTTGDIIDCYDCNQQWSMGWKVILDLQMSLNEGSHEGLEVHAGPDGWNDPDMMEVGNDGLTYAESRAHFSFWCLLAAPLIAGNDVREMSPAITALLTDADAIAINQDPLGQQGYRYYQDDNKEIWVRPLSDGDWAFILHNASDETRTVEIDFSHMWLFGEGDFKLYDIWEKRVLGKKSELPVVARELAPHDALFVRMRALD